MPIRNLPFAFLPLALALPTSSPAASAVWPDLLIHLHGAGQAYLVDSKTDTVLATLDTCKGGTLGATTPDARKAYVSCAGEGQTEVVVLDLERKAVSKRIPTGNRPKHGIVSPDGKLVGINHWGLDGGKLRVSFLDVATDQVARHIDLEVTKEARGVTSMHNAFSPDSRLFFTLDRVDNRLVVIDTRDWSVTGIAVPSAPHYAVPSPDGTELWLLHEGAEGVKPGIVVYDLTKVGYPVKHEMEMPLIGEEVVEAHHGNFTQDGKLFLALSRGPGKDPRGREVAVYDARTKALLHRVTTASNGVGHTYNTPDGAYAVVTNYGNNVVSILNTKTLRIDKDLTVGSGRMGHVAFTKDGAYGYLSNDKDGVLYKLDMKAMKVVGKVETAGKPGGGQVLNVWTNVFEELPR